MPAAQRGTAFTACPRRDLDLIFSLQFERTVGRDNTVSFQNLALQIDKVSWRGTLAGCSVVVHQHLDGTVRMTHGPRRLGHYTSKGTPIAANSGAPAVEKPPRGKVKKRTFPPGLEIPQMARDSHFQQLDCDGGINKHKPDVSSANKTGHFHLLTTVSMLPVSRTSVGCVD